MTSLSEPRSRPLLSICFIAVIALGLASRRYPLLPEFLGKYPGDALWAVMVFVGLAFLAPRASTVCLAIAAYAISCAVEFSQLYHAPWIDAIRATTMGHLVLGSTFSSIDIVAYAIGVLVAALLDFVLTGGLAEWKIQRSSPST